MVSNDKIFTMAEDNENNDIGEETIKFTYPRSCF